MPTNQQTTSFVLKTKAGYYRERPGEYPALDAPRDLATELPAGSARHIAQCLPSDYRPIMMEQV